MKTKLQIKSIFGSLLFEYECEENSIKKTLEKAIKENADLSSADLRYANLRSADLSSANIRSADLRSANLRYADLHSANLRYAENKEEAYIPQFCKWTHSIKGDKIQIGCKEKTIKEWQDFFSSKEEYSTKRGTVEFKQIQAIFESYKAYLNHLNS